MQWWRPQTQFLSLGSAGRQHLPQRRWGAAARPRRPETLHGLVAVVLSALQQVDGGCGRGQQVGAVRVPDAEGDLAGLGVDEGRAAGQRDAADPGGCGGEGAQRAGEVLHVMPRRHVAGVACFQLVSRLCVSSSWAPATTSMLVFTHAF